MILPDSDLNACCSLSYGHPVARWLMGDSFHPGGLALTSQLALAAGIDANSIVPDIGSGLGATAVHLAKTVGCQVVGVTLEQEGVETGYRMARHHELNGKVTFIKGDIYQMALEADSFDAVLTECVLSILGDKATAIRLINALLRPGGRLGITDVTVNGPLPPELQGILAKVGCVGDARSLEEYRALLEGSGMVVERSHDLDGTASSFLKGVKSKLLMAQLAGALGKFPLDKEVIEEAKRILASVEELVRQGVLSYGMIVAHKPAQTP